METLIIGSGCAGSVAARLLAEQGEKVKVLEKRAHIAGNCYDRYDEFGVLVHQYGPHIFHTKEKEVYEFLSRFTEWYNYSHEVVGNVYGKILPIPFNLNTLEIVYGKEKAKVLRKELIETYGLEARVPILKLKENESEAIREIADFVYENIFLKYTMKQWNQKPEEVDQSVTARVPVLISEDNRYFQDPYQGMPLDGYTAMFEKMLDHENIEVVCNCDAKDHLSFDFENHQVLVDGEVFDGKVIFTGAIDALFDYALGKLPYRSLRFDFEHVDKDFYQPAGVVNYTVSEDYTRITEFKRLTGQQIKGTTIIKEYPQEYVEKSQEPYYPILDSVNREMYQKYMDMLHPFKNFYCLGRLAQYQYFNIDQIVKEAIMLCESFKETK